MTSENYAQRVERTKREATGQGRKRQASCRADHAVVRKWCDVCPECGAVLDA